MKFDIKQLVLIAIYTEYQKDLPQMGNITPEAIGLDAELFNVAICKLDNEGYIKDAIMVFAGDEAFPVVVQTPKIKISNTGIEYVEKFLEIDKALVHREKVRKVVEKLMNGVVSKVFINYVTQVLGGL